MPEPSPSKESTGGPQGEELGSVAMWPLCYIQAGHATAATALPLHVHTLPPEYLVAGRSRIAPPPAQVRMFRTLPPSYLVGTGRQVLNLGYNANSCGDNGRRGQIREIPVSRFLVFEGICRNIRLIVL